MSVIESMRAFHRSGRQTQPRFLSGKGTRSVQPTAKAAVVDGLGTALVVLQPQFVQQLLEMGRQTGRSGRFGNEILPQPLSDSLADRCAGRTVDFVSIAISVGHYRFRLAFISIR